MKQAVKRVLPPALRVRAQRAYRLLRVKRRYCQCFYSDYRRYVKYSAPVQQAPTKSENLTAMIMMEAHAVEKAFSLPEVRAGFGELRLKKLVELMAAYHELGFPADVLALKKARSVLRVYLDYHDNLAFDLGPLRALIEPWAADVSDIGGFVEFDREDILKAAHGSFEDLSQSRWSVRQYSDTPITDEEIRDVVRLAKKTPSVCNRQAWKAYFVRDAELKESVLRLQNGNTGFGDSASCVVIVTTDLRSFVGPAERNEAHIDGGMFAMSLLYAFHFKGIGACPLNWMVMPEADQRLRRITGIPDSECIIMMITAGHLPEHMRAAKSVRGETDQFVFIL